MGTLMKWGLVGAIIGLVVGIIYGSIPAGILLGAAGGVGLRKWIFMNFWQ
ncbi:MAG TPA: hypothetical protein VIM51_10940 [Desulfosporosinus sp.]